MRDEFPPASASTLTAAQRQQLEADHTFKRLVELELEPVRGSFDAAHLKAVHHRIFQDLPDAGFHEVTPGEFRTQVPHGQDWMKQRGLSTMGGTFHVVYSRMDDAAMARLDKALEEASPDELRGLLRDAVRPSRAVAFEQLNEREALSEHPELEAAYKTVHAAATHLASQMPGHPEAQKVGIQSVMNHVQNCLNAGETADFGHSQKR